jgi:hypothetical protein
VFGRDLAEAVALASKCDLIAGQLFDRRREGVMTVAIGAVRRRSVLELPVTSPPTSPSTSSSTSLMRVKS